FLRLTVGVHISRVNEVDSGVQGPMNDSVALILVAVAPCPKHHCAQAQLANFDSRATQGLILHATTLLSTPDFPRNGVTNLGCCCRASEFGSEELSIGSDAVDGSFNPRGGLLLSEMAKHQSATPDRSNRVRL